MVNVDGECRWSMVNGECRWSMLMVNVDGQCDGRWSMSKWIGQCVNGECRWSMLRVVGQCGWTMSMLMLGSVNVEVDGRC